MTLIVPIIVAAAVIGVVLFCLFRPSSSPAPAPLVFYTINSQRWTIPAGQTTISYAQVLQTLLGTAYNPAVRPVITYNVGGIATGILISGQNIKLVNAMAFRVS